MIQGMISDIQNQILYGSVLGDACVEAAMTRGNRFLPHRARVRFDHSVRELDYLQWKHRALPPYCTQMREIKVFDKRTGRWYKKVRFDTLALPIFYRLREIFYVENRKVIPSDISQHLNSPLTLAVWYLDDGGKKTDCRAYRLHTNCYSLLEVEGLRRGLKERFGIDAAAHKQGKGFLLYIGARNGQAERFCEIVRPVVSSEISSMLHKFH